MSLATPSPYDTLLQQSITSLTHTHSHRPRKIHHDDTTPLKGNSDHHSDNNKENHLHLNGSVVDRSDSESDSDSENHHDNDSRKKENELIGSDKRGHPCHGMNAASVGVQEEEQKEMNGNSYHGKVKNMEEKKEDGNHHNHDNNTYIPPPTNTIHPSFTPSSYRTHRQKQKHTLHTHPHPHTHTHTSSPATAVKHHPSFTSASSSSPMVSAAPATRPTSSSPSTHSSQVVELNHDDTEYIIHRLDTARDDVYQKLEAKLQHFSQYKQSTQQHINLLETQLQQYQSEKQLIDTGKQQIHQHYLHYQQRNQMIRCLTTYYIQWKNSMLQHQQSRYLMNQWVIPLIHKKYLKDAMSIWCRGMYEKRRAREQQVYKEYMKDTTSRLIENYERNIEMLREELKSTQFELHEMKAHQLNMNDQLKEAFIRAACAVNTEALRVFNQTSNTQKGYDDVKQLNIPHELQDVLQDGRHRSDERGVGKEWYTETVSPKSIESLPQPHSYPSSIPFTSSPASSSSQGVPKTVQKKIKHQSHESNTAPAAFPVVAVRHSGH